MSPLLVAEHAIELNLTPDEALNAVWRTAEDWGAEFQREGDGGRLHLPVLAGLRKGLVSGPVEVRPEAAGSRVVFRPDSSTYYVQTQAVMVLLFSVAGALLTLAWPFFPELITVAPFGAVIAIGGWFLVLSRLRTSGPDDFLGAVAAWRDAAEQPSDAAGQA
ncbi:MAG: hypothetical protein ACJ75H_08420 [Thermoanaerobaculia bacterium]